MGIIRARRRMGGALVAILILATTVTIGGVVLAAAPIGSVDLGDSERDALQGTIALLQWALIAVSGGMASAVAILWRSIRDKDRAIIDEVKSSSKIREEFIGELRANREARDQFRERIDSVSEKVEYCDPRRDREESDVGRGGVR